MLVFFTEVTSHLTQSFCSICCSSPADGFEVEVSKFLEVARLKSKVQKSGRIR